MKGILISSEQVQWFMSLLEESYGDKNSENRYRILGAFEMLIFQPQEDYVIALNAIPKDKWKPIFSEEIKHKKGE